MWKQKCKACGCMWTREHTHVYACMLKWVSEAPRPPLLLPVWGTGGHSQVLLPVLVGNCPTALQPQLDLVEEEA